MFLIGLSASVSNAVAGTATVVNGQVVLTCDRFDLKIDAATGKPTSFYSKTGNKELLKISDPGPGFLAVVNGVAKPLSNLSLSNGNSQLIARTSDNLQQATFDLLLGAQYIGFNVKTPTMLQGFGVQGRSLAFKMNLIDGTGISGVPHNYMVSKSDKYDQKTVGWKWYDFISPNGVNSVPGGFSIFQFTAAVDHDETLLRIWADPGAAISHPNIGASAWDYDAAKKWLAAWTKQFIPYRGALSLSGPTLADLYKGLEYADVGGCSEIWLWPGVWHGQLNTGSTLFPKGLTDMRAFADACRAKNISMGLFGSGDRSFTVDGVPMSCAALSNRVGSTYMEYSEGYVDDGFGTMEKRVEETYRQLDHPTTANYSAWEPPAWFEYNFMGTKSSTGTELGAVLRVADPSRTATSLLMDDFHYFTCALDGLAMGLCSGAGGITTDMFSLNGRSMDVLAHMKLWRDIARRLAPETLIQIKQYNKGVPLGQSSAYPYTYVPEDQANAWTIYPVAVLNTGTQNSLWRVARENGPIEPWRYVKANTDNTWSNPFPQQPLRFMLHVLPATQANSAENYVLQAGSKTHAQTNSLSVPTTTIEVPGLGVDLAGKTDWSSHRPVCMTVTGDKLNEVLILKLDSNPALGDTDHARYYAVPIDFTGPREIEIPNGEAAYALDSWGWKFPGKNKAYDKISTVSMGFGSVPASSSVSVTVSGIKAMKEYSVGLTNPVIRTSQGTLTVAGFVPTDYYLEYQGGTSAILYDANWNRKATLPVMADNFTVPTGNSNITISTTQAGPMPWLQVQFLTRGTPITIQKTSADIPPVVAGGPAGYTWCASENRPSILSGTCDVAYGANGQFKYLYSRTGVITFNNATFGDPIPGVVKNGYYKPSGTPATYTLTASASLGGSITPSGAVPVNSGLSKVFTITPNSEYRIADVKVDGVSFGAVTSYTFSNVAADHSIAATFQANSGGGPAGYTLCASENETYALSGTCDVAYGANGLFNYLYGRTGSITFNNATFRDPISGVGKKGYYKSSSTPVTYTLTASAGSGGSITPSGAVTVNGGASKAYVISPNTGFTVAEVTVDGVSVGAVTSYTFSNVTANHSIAATFQANSGGGPAGYIYCAEENGAYVLTGTCDVAYGAYGSFNYLYGRTGSVTFNNVTFGDPISGVGKKGYYKTSGSTAEITVACDNGYELYVNGALVGSGNNWQMAQKISGVALPNGKNVIAIKGIDAGGIAALLSEVVVDGRRIGSGAEWKVSLSASANWKDVGFDDSAWVPATDYGAYGVSPWVKNVANMPTDTPAHWIWSSNNDTANEVYFRCVVTVGNAGVPSPWLSQDIGSVGTVGSTGFNSGEFTVKGAGVDIGSTADSLQYAYQIMSGDGSIVARMTGMSDQALSKVCLMMRESLTPGSKHVMVLLNFGTGAAPGSARLASRSSTGGDTAWLNGAGGMSLPRWFQLARVGNTFTGYVSTDAQQWTQVGTSSVTMGTTIYMGLGVCNRNSSTLGIATMDNVTAVP